MAHSGSYEDVAGGWLIVEGAGGGNGDGQGVEHPWRARLRPGTVGFPGAGWLIILRQQQYTKVGRDGGSTRVGW
jgi:hypothetical protein